MLFMPSSTPGVSSSSKVITPKKIISYEKPDNKIEKIDNSLIEKIKIDWILKKTEADKNSMSIWLKKDYETALGIVALAEKSERKNEFYKTENYYKQAIQTIDIAFNKKQQILLESINKGLLALENENIEQAEKFFKVAQAIDPENETMLKSLHRIANREEVLTIYGQAIEQEKKNNLSAAISKLNKALTIEPEYKRAYEKLQIIEKKKLEQDFNKSVDKILNALEYNDFNSAKIEIENAKKIDATKPIINELEKRLDNKIKVAAVKNLKSKAIKQEQKEQWQSALSTYQKILKYDSDTSSGVVNEERARAYIKLNKLLDDIIDRPERVQNDKVLERAMLTLESIEFELGQKNNLLYSIKNTQQLAEKINQVKIIIKEASIIIPVIIKSDNETDVSVYKIGQYGKIYEKKINLRPGKYTIVGTRANYRDHRQVLIIKASDKSKIIDVRCREKI